MSLEECSVERDGVVEERRAAEQRVPARHCPPRLWKVNLPRSSIGDELEDTGPDERDVGLRPEPREYALEPVWERDVVRVHPRDVPSLNDVETTVEGSGEPAALVVPYDANARIVERGKDGRGRIGRSVIDDDELEVGHRLAKDALERRSQVVRRRRGRRRGRKRAERWARHPLAYGACRPASLRSTWSWQRSVASQSSTACSTRSMPRRTAGSG